MKTAMNNNTIRIALSSVLIYLSFKKLYDVLATFLLWGSIEFRIENKTVLITLNLLVGLLSVLILIGLSNRILKNNKVENRTIFLLTGLTAILTICMIFINWSYSEYISNSMIKIYGMYIFQFEWSKTLDVIIPIFGLLYFLWKIKRNSEVVS